MLVRDVALLESIFSTRREFLLDAAAGDREVNFTDRGLQLTRSFRAFKLWLSLKVFGLDAFAAAVQHGMDLAGYADALLRRRTGWEVAAPTRLALVSFRFADHAGRPRSWRRSTGGSPTPCWSTSWPPSARPSWTAAPPCACARSTPARPGEDVEATLARVEELAAIV